MKHLHRPHRRAQCPLETLNLLLWAGREAVATHRNSRVSSGFEDPNSWERQRDQSAQRWATLRIIDGMAHSPSHGMEAAGGMGTSRRSSTAMTRSQQPMQQAPRKYIFLPIKSQFKPKNGKPLRVAHQPREVSLGLDRIGSTTGDLSIPSLFPEPFDEFRARTLPRLSPS